MNYEEIEKKLKEIKIEDYIWLIYIGIIFLSWYANNLERSYIIFKDKLSKEKYQSLMIFIFAVLWIIYIYFLYTSFDSLKNLKENDNQKKKDLVSLSFIATLLLFISGTIFLYISITDSNLDVELAFN